MHRNIIFIVNPISGSGEKNRQVRAIEKITAAAGIPYTIFPSVASGNYNFLKPLIEEQQVTDVVICGGDGTVSQVVGCLKEMDISFGIIPCGSGNGLAFAAKIPKNITRALNIVFDNKKQQVDGYLVNNQFACMLTGLGFDAKVAHDFANQKTRGLTTYVKEIIKSFFSAKTYSFELKFQNKKFNVDAYFISIANGNQFGNHFTIAPFADLSDGLLDVVVLGQQNKLTLLYNTFKQVTGFNKFNTNISTLQNNSVIYFQTPEIKVYNTSNAPLHIDGEPVDTVEKLTIKILPQCFRLLIP